MGLNPLALTAVAIGAPIVCVAINCFGVTALRGGLKHPLLMLEVMTSLTIPASATILATFSSCRFAMLN
jgi:hypothetical protein